MKEEDVKKKKLFSMLKKEKELKKESKEIVKRARQEARLWRKVMEAHLQAFS